MRGGRLSWQCYQEVIATVLLSIVNVTVCIVGQPGQRPAPQFMAAPAAIPGVPQGLEYLAQIDQILVHQQIELFERTYYYHTTHDH